MLGPIGHCYGMAMSADGKLVACIGGGRVHMYDIENRKPLPPIEPNAHILCGVTFSPDGQILAIGSQDKQIVIWDLRHHKEINRLNGHEYAVGQMAILPDNQTLISASHDSTIKFWKVR
jgi:WD40 repeat protein